MVVWLAAGGKVERMADRTECARVLTLYQASLARGQSLLMTRHGQSQVVLDVRCAPRYQAPVS